MKKDREDRASYRNNSGIIQKIRNIYCKYIYFAGRMGGGYKCSTTCRVCADG